MQHGENPALEVTGRRAEFLEEKLIAFNSTTFHGKAYGCYMILIPLSTVKSYFPFLLVGTNSELDQTTQNWIIDNILDFTKAKIE